MSRFSQAISEGDGISVVPLVAGDVAALAATAEEAGAEAIAVRTPAEAEVVRAHTSLAVVVRGPIVDPRGVLAVHAAGADACVLVFERLAGEGELLEELYAVAGELRLACALDVRDEDELEQALARLDPEIVVLSERDAERGEEELERTLDLLPDVPAGKLVISEAHVVEREQVLALERAGVDALFVEVPTGGYDFAAALGALVGR